MSMASCLTREKLYEAVWAETLSTLAPMLNVSVAGLKKACSEAHIPLPGRIYWAKHRAGQMPVRVALPIRSAGMSEDIILDGTHLSWLQDLSDDEILSWPVDPPSFPDDIDTLRERVRGDLGRVEVQPTWDGAHSEVRRLLRTDAGRQERQRRTSVKFPWEAPRFDAVLGQRQLRILNAIFLGVVRVGGKGQVGGGDRLETRIFVHGTSVAFSLAAIATETRTSKRGASPSTDPAGRLRLSILNVLGSDRDRISWQDEKGASLETRITDIAVELIATAEINYREACIRRHLWVSEKRDAIRERLAENRRVAQVAARTNAAAVGKARLDNLLGMASDYRQARAIRLFVAAMRRRCRDGDGFLALDGFEDWCRWALAEADTLDPAKNWSKFSIASQQEK
jgi:hypothetical protein